VLFSQAKPLQLSPLLAINITHCWLQQGMDPLLLADLGGRQHTKLLR